MNKTTIILLASTTNYLVIKNDGYCFWTWPRQKSMEIDLSLLIFRESHEIDGVYYPDIKVTTSPIKKDNVKRLVKNIEQKVFTN